MKKWLLIALACAFSLTLKAQDPYGQLGAKLEEYFTALAGESAQVQNAECDFLIQSCQDSLVRQYVALKIYDHYLQSKIMGDDAVAVHVADRWFLSGEIPMASEEDLLNARIFAEFNRSSLAGAPAPKLSLQAPDGSEVKFPSAQGYSILYFYDTGCSSCKMETARLKHLLKTGEYPVTVFAMYTGSDAEAWENYRSGFEGVTHVWDPEIRSEWQRLYGVLKTPALFLVSPSGTILGRGLDTPALRILLNREMASDKYVYGESGQMARYGQLFSVYGDTLTVAHVMDVADYLAARTLGEGDSDAFRQVAGDLLYYLSSRREEVYHDASIPFVKKYIEIPDIWTSRHDQSEVVSLGRMMADLASRTPAGSLVPELSVPGVLRQKKCLLRKGSKEGTFALRKLRGRPSYVVFYTAGCSSCEETLAAVERVLQENRRAKVLLVDMDALFTDNPLLATELLKSFDLSAMPFVIQLDRKGVVQHRYVQL